MNSLQVYTYSRIKYWKYIGFWNFWSFSKGGFSFPAISRKLKTLLDHAHQIQKPIPKLEVRIFTNFLTNEDMVCVFFIYLLVFFFYEKKWCYRLKNCKKFSIHSFRISCWIRWIKGLTYLTSRKSDKVNCPLSTPNLNVRHL